VKRGEHHYIDQLEGMLQKKYHFKMPFIMKDNYGVLHIVKNKT